MQKSFRVGLAQISPVWLHRQATLDKVITAIKHAATEGCQLLSFGESLVPGYPFWLSRTDGSTFESPRQKAIHARYLAEGVDLEAGHLSGVCAAAQAAQMGIYLGIAERPVQRGGHTLYCSLVYIDPEGAIQSVHRKLMPTYEERLAWGIGDGHGLRVHACHSVSVGGLNCWENWMPLPRASLYAQGEHVHVAVWPGSENNTATLTPHIAREGRVFAVSTSALLHRDAIPDDLPYAAEIKSHSPEWLADGGSCVAAPDASWVLPPQTHKEQVFVAELDLEMIARERQNFDPSGHYARPEVLKLEVDRRRHVAARFIDDSENTPPSTTNT